MRPFLFAFFFFVFFFRCRAVNDLVALLKEVRKAVRRNFCSSHDNLYIGRSVANPRIECSCIISNGNVFHAKKKKKKKTPSKKSSHPLLYQVCTRPPCVNTFAPSL